jgi:hypothetical protein
VPGGPGWPLRLRRAAKGMLCTVEGFVVESALLVPSLLGLGRPLVWDTNELETLHYFRRRGGVEDLLRGAAWFGLESMTGTVAKAVVAISRDEARHWRRLFPWFASKVVVCDHLPVLGRSSTVVPDDQAAFGRRVLFLGNLSAKHNIEAARWCIDVLRPVLPIDTELVLVGRGTDDMVAAYGAPAGVQGLGFVDNVDSVLATATLTVAPLAAGAGVKTKVLHALALGLRVVGTPVAFEGLGNPPGSTSVDLGEVPSAVGRLLAAPELPVDRAARLEAQRAWAEQLLDEGRLRRQWAAALRRAGLLRVAEGQD